MLRMLGQGGRQCTVGSCDQGHICLRDFKLESKNRNEGHSNVVRKQHQSKRLTQICINTKSYQFIGIILEDHKALHQVQLPFYPLRESLLMSSINSLGLLFQFNHIFCIIEDKCSIYIFRCQETTYLTNSTMNESLARSHYFMRGC